MIKITSFLLKMKKRCIQSLLRSVKNSSQTLILKRFQILKLVKSMIQKSRPRLKNWSITFNKTK